MRREILTAVALVSVAGCASIIGADFGDKTLGTGGDAGGMATSTEHGGTGAMGSTGGNAGSGANGTSTSTSTSGGGGSVACNESCVWPVCPTGPCDDPTQITAGDSHTCALRASGAVVCWGYNREGQLGNGTTNDSSKPVTVHGLEDATQVVAGNLHTCALRKSGAVVCWGANDGGQLGDGMNHMTCLGGDDCSDTPVAVTAVTQAVALAAGTNFTCALDSSSNPSHVYCWGGNTKGQCGNGSTTSPASGATAVTGLTDAVEIAAGADSSTVCAVHATGAVSCWGANDFGQLGDGMSTHMACGGTDCSPSPVDVMLPFPATHLAGASRSVCATVATGAYCWGDNEAGQLGNGSMTASSTPVNVDSLTASPAIAGGGDSESGGLASGDHFCAVRAAGGLIVCWGTDRWFQLGDGTAPSNCPLNGVGSYPCDSFRLAVGGVPGAAIELAVGTASSCALLTSNAIVCWGYNGDGQLGNGTTTPTMTNGMPVQVVSP